ncbi:excalibur calcium-binding domain-containing protein [Streptomyces sp. NPDC096079]|uniref:excalibur calcium-binding domain-containing protein n=1 Tax=Streptomyces sp. NPDC096079 TaxID=3155820 RepID=UPI00333154BD
MAVKRRLSRSRAIGRGVLVLAAAAVVLVVVVLVRDGSDSAPQGRNSAPAWCTPGTPRSALCPDSEVFDAKEYATHGNAFECVNFASQADAQAVLRADPRDPNRLDDGGGVACRGLPEPRDTEPVARERKFTCGPGDPRSALCPQPKRAFDARWFLRFGNDAYDCSDLASQADAQAVLRFEQADPNRLDDDGDGIACPDLPGPEDDKPVRR